MSDRTAFARYVTGSARLVDGILRGTRGTGPRRPDEESVGLREAVLATLPLAAIYGLCMGLAAGPGMAALVALKIPIVLFLGIVICYPSFYVFSALTGAPLNAAGAARALGALALLTGVVWAALAPVTGFFTLSTDPASGFIAWLHGLALALGVLIGLLFLGRELTAGAWTRLRPPPPLPPEAVEVREDPDDPDAPAIVDLKEPPPLAPPPRPVSIGFFLVWVVVFACVVCQLFADFSPYLESGPFVQDEPRFFLDVRGIGGR